MKNLKYKRCLLKLSGAAFSGKNIFFNFVFAERIIKQVKILKKENREIIIVLGAGNICRARTYVKELSPQSQIPLDYSGMLGTVINGLFLKECFLKQGIKVALLSSIGIDTQIAYSYNFDLANNLLKELKILILVGGIGTPNFSTDFTAVLKAKELNVDVLLLGKNGVDGIYSEDPALNPKATWIEKISYHDVVSRKLNFVDLSAAAFNINEKVDCLVFDINKNNSILEVLKNKGKFSIVSNS